jgi:histidine phosphotransferase ChpT
MSNSEVDLASLLCSKICHDLLSPVGAINNGLELLEDESDPVMRDRCMDLLADSARVSADKLKYFRLAFGAAGGFGDEVDPAEARQLIESLIGDSGKITLGWALQNEALPSRWLEAVLWTSARKKGTWVSKWLFGQRASKSHWIAVSGQLWTARLNRLTLAPGPQQRG